MEYKKLDKEILKHKQRHIASSDDALRDIVPINWSNDVINGSKKIIINKANHL